MSTWYIEQELGKFESGARGMNFEDAEGMHMQPMALSLVSDDDVKAVSRYAAGLPRPKLVSPLDGDAKAGEALYATCMPCHGANGEGNEGLKSPPVAGVEDWYLATELRKFKTGVRGTNPEDQEGALMHNMAATLADEKAIRDVVAYMGTLKP
jgi:cytochrome c oxidase subunit 2